MGFAVIELGKKDSILLFHFFVIDIFKLDIFIFNIFIE